jgi:hypothetical protein
MILVFEAPSTEKAKLSALLDADPYGQVSFSRNGYKLRDGITVSQDKDKVYIFLKCTDEFAAFAKEKLTGLATESKPEVASAIAKVIEGEENNAEAGFGSIFGE